jgi:heavy metal translocating P-type ATPase
VNHLPDKIYLWKNGTTQEIIDVDILKVGDEFLVRKGEVVPIDGVLKNDSGYFDESSVTGEPYTIDKFKGQIIRSGTVNTGEPVVVEAIKTAGDSSYRKIVEMVKKAQKEKSPIIRIADRYSIVFTIVTLAIAISAYLLTRDFDRVLAVLVVATPCPLILATPIALMGGLNSAAKEMIIIKNLAVLELISRSKDIIFDKTGTLTLGVPQVSQVLANSDLSEDDLAASAAALEKNSLHPIAKAVVEYAERKNLNIERAVDIKETIGEGISGVVNNKRYEITKGQSQEKMSVDVLLEGKIIGSIFFEDKIKKNTKAIITKLISDRYSLTIFTGDKESRVKELLDELELDLDYKAECKPEEKLEGIAALQSKGRITTMIGDGINDAPALAKADVGIVFSNEEQTASSEAANVVILGGDMKKVLKTMTISKKTVEIAKQSIFFGIGISIGLMVFASFGFIVPIVGAILQEVIDVAVILNSLRTTKIKV